MHKSNSAVQLRAEEEIFAKVQTWFRFPLNSSARVTLRRDPNICICPDFYSEEARVIGEIFAHIGKPKKAQDNKIANDILKMLLLEQDTGMKYKKYIVVCDEEEFRALGGESALAESIRQFGVKLRLVRISSELRSELLAAQSRQKMVNES